MTQRRIAEDIAAWHMILEQIKTRPQPYTVEKISYEKEIGKVTIGVEALRLIFHQVQHIGYSSLHGLDVVFQEFHERSRIQECLEVFTTQQTDNNSLMYSSNRFVSTSRC